MDEEVRARRLILRILYNARRRSRPGAVESDQLESDQRVRNLGLTSADVQFHVDYLVETELVQVLMPTVGQRMFSVFRITAEGINLVEDPSEFNGRFPPQVIVQTIHGDKLDIVIGDHNSNVLVGKDIVHVSQISASTNSVQDVCKQFVQDLSGSLGSEPNQMAQVIEHVHRLERILTEKDLDLGEVQRIKNFLAKREGRPASRTALLFSHDAVTRPIREATKHLIGCLEGSVADE